MFGPVLAETLRVVRGYTGGERALIAEFLRKIAGITERAAQRGRRPL